MNIGRMIFFDKITGDKIVDTGEYKDAILKKTADEQIATFKALSERNRETFDVIELPYGAYAQDFSEGRLIGVDLKTKTPIFEYPNPENPAEPIVPPKPLSVEMDAIRREKDALEQRLQAAEDFLLFLSTM